MHVQLDKVEEVICYRFVDTRLLQTALVHRSYLNEKDRDDNIIEHNERLEFLGDAVLELVVTEYLYKNFADSEGLLTALRAALVNYKLMGEVGNSLGLDEIVLISKGEKEELGRARLTIVADCMEAIIGAMYLDGGIIPCHNFIREFILVRLQNIIANQSYKDNKTILQEFAQKYLKSTPSYKVLSSEGKDHEKVFTVGVLVGGSLVARGDGRSKQDAETAAAAIALSVLQESIPQESDSNLIVR